MTTLLTLSILSLASTPLCAIGKGDGESSPRKSLTPIPELDESPDDSDDNSDHPSDTTLKGEMIHQVSPDQGMGGSPENVPPLKGDSPELLRFTNTPPHGAMKSPPRPFRATPTKSSLPSLLPPDLDVSTGDNELSNIFDRNGITATRARSILEHIFKDPTPYHLRQIFSHPTLGGATISENLALIRRFPIAEIDQYKRGLVAAYQYLDAQTKVKGQMMLFNTMLQESLTRIDDAYNTTLFDPPRHSKH